MKLEGLIIHKTLYKERDLICKLLLRDGHVCSLYFYGGRGGGKKNKGSLLELGYMVSVVVDIRHRGLNQQLQVAKEWSLIWQHQEIRKDYKAFYFLSFICEVLQKT